jgi:hypothetical protein
MQTMTHRFFVFSLLGLANVFGASEKALENSLSLAKTTRAWVDDKDFRQAQVALASLPEFYEI